MKAATRFDLMPLKVMGISIHAAREGGDGYTDEAKKPLVISIHAAREGGDGQGYACSVGRKAFQSTPPVKAATSDFAGVFARSLFQSTPPVKAATRLRKFDPVPFGISIHAAREGGDGAAKDISGGGADFNPRRP